MEMLECMSGGDKLVSVYVLSVWAESVYRVNGQIHNSSR